MKKFSLVVLFIGILFLSFGVKAKELDSIIKGQVDSQDIYYQLSFKKSYKSKNYKSGIIDNYLVVETSGVADLRKNQKICALTDYYEIYSSTPFTVNKNITEKYPTFIAFNEANIKDGYMYTLFNGLGLCNDENTTSTNKDGRSFHHIGVYPELWTTCLAENYASHTFDNIPIGKKGVQLMLMGDIVVTNITIKQYQKLWFGDDRLEMKTVTAYICCNVKGVDYYE